ncbi:TetR/AcrR family transcriptional regulator [Erythrobacter sp. CCH5-A1]|jgi:AcrR family transcriptional regulator|uniref:TetR/AcrR family transcriptional regulator n=1 Tax=Erythrobacter sp. CCH5-A1 TaxID=1768792 RepID=UPI00082E0EE0|nr:TetR/AcrR family transcriptional regulator [Erythrobacter sp. CCH5-A1]
MMARTQKSTGVDLREACLDEALAIITQSGVEKLSLREVARRLGVSHQAPYRHFASRDHLLAEIVRRAFADFAAALRSPPTTDDPAADALAMGFAYVRFALTEPLKYRLIFGGSLPDPHAHTDMMLGARESFEVLRASLTRVARARGETPTRESIDAESLFAWSSLHGVVSLMRTDAMGTLDLAQGARDAFVMQALQKIGAALGIVRKPEGGGA